METTEIFRVQAESVKDLKEQIVNLKDEIVRLKSADKDYSQEAGQLQAAQRMLNETMALTKKEATALDGSYDALVHKMAELKKQWRATNDEAERDALGKQIKSINTDLKNLDASIGNFQRSVGAYGQVYDDLGKGMNNVKQVGGDLANGIMAMSSVLGLSAQESDNLKDSLGSLNGVLGIFQSAKGIAGAISGLKAFITNLKGSKKATDAQTVSTKAETVAQEANTTATTLGSKAIKIFGLEIKLALPIIGAITLAIGLLVKNWDKVMKLLGLQKPTVEATAKAYDKYKKSTELLNNQREREYALMKAKGATDKEILKLKIENIKADIANAQVQQIILETDLEQLKQAKAKQEDIQKATELYEEQTSKVEALGEKLKDLQNELVIAGIIAAQNAAKSAKEKLDEMVKASEAAQKEVDKILQSGMKPLEKIQAVYDENIKKLKELKDAEIALAQQQKKDTTEIEARYARAEAVYNQERIDSIREYAKTSYNALYNGYEQRMQIAYREKDEWNEIFEGLKADAEGTASAVTEYNRKMSEERIERLEAEKRVAFDTLKAVGYELSDPELYKQFTSATDQQLLLWYDELLTNEEEFAKKYPEPFISALRQIAPRILDIESEQRNELVRFVEGTMNEIQEAVDNLKPGEANSLFEKLLENPPATMSPELKEKLKGYVATMKRALGEAIVESNKLSQGEKTSYLVELFGDAESIPRDLKLKVITDQIVTYSQTAVNALDQVASAWMNIMNAQKENLKFLLESDAITQEEYEKRAKAMDERNEKSFKNMKALQYATAVVNTAGAVVQALVDPAVPTYYLRAINAAAALATGIAEVAQISGTHYQRMTSVSAPTISQPTPSVNTIGLSDYANLIEQNNEPIKVYVTDSDLKAGIDHYNETKAEVTF